MRSSLLLLAVLVLPGGAAHAEAQAACACTEETVAASSKAVRRIDPSASIQPAGDWAFQLAAGKSFGEPWNPVLPFEWFGNLRVSLSDDVQLSLLSPGIAWRLGEPGAIELILDARIRFGMRGYGVEAIPWPGAFVRLYTGPSFSFLLGAQAGIVNTREDQLRVWMWSSQASWIFHTGPLTFAAGVAANVEREVVLSAIGGGPHTTHPATTTAFGSVLHLASIPVPLLSLHLSDAFSLDGYGTVFLHPDDKIEAISLAGFTTRF